MVTDSNCGTKFSISSIPNFDGDQKELPTCLYCGTKEDETYWSGSLFDPEDLVTLSKILDWCKIHSVELRFRTF